jgi:thiol:disulfide interchange protein DsbD
VLGQQSSIDGAGALLAILVALSAVLWSLTLQGQLRIVLASVLIAIAVGLGWTLWPYLTQVSATPSTPTQNERWQAWTPERAQQLISAGQPVFVDFTAAWCVTCQYNKKTTLTNAGLLADLDAKKVQLLRADWTRRDPAITAALAQLGRNGVPVYVLYAKGKAPIVLSEIISVQEVRDALVSL